MVNDREDESYNNGIYYVNAVNDLGLDNTGATDCSGDIETALREMFNSGARTGTMYFPAGTYRLDSKVTCQNVGSSERVAWVIKGDGTSTKFRTGPNNTTGAFDIRFGRAGQGGYKDNYITVQDLSNPS